MQDRKINAAWEMLNKTAGVENIGPENAGPRSLHAKYTERRIGCYEFFLQKCSPKDPVSGNL